MKLTTSSFLHFIVRFMGYDHGKRSSLVVFLQSVKGCTIAGRFEIKTREELITQREDLIQDEDKIIQLREDGNTFTPEQKRKRRREIFPTNDWL